MKKKFIIERRSDIYLRFRFLLEIEAESKEKVLEILRGDPEFVVFPDGKVEYIISKGFNRECRIIELPPGATYVKKTTTQIMNAAPGELD